MTTRTEGTAKTRLRFAKVSQVRAVFGGQPAFGAFGSASTRIHP